MILLKKSALLMFFMILTGCNQQTKIDSGSTISATVWSLQNGLFAKDLIVDPDNGAQSKLHEMKCQVALSVELKDFFIVNRSSIACDKKDLIDFSATLFDQDGNPTKQLHIGQVIKLKLTKPLAI